MSRDIIDILANDLRSEIERGLIHQKWIETQQDPETALFAPLKLSKTILKKGIRPLFKAISDDEHVEEDAETALRAETAVYRILAILIFIRCDTSILKNFRKCFISNSTTAKRDSALPLQKSDAEDLFGARLGDQFYNRQFIFCPVVLQEDKEVEYRGDRQCCRLPFSDSEILGHGSSGTVSKVTIPKGHFNWSDPTRGPNRQACTSFHHEYHFTEP